MKSKKCDTDIDDHIRKFYTNYVCQVCYKGFNRLAKVNYEPCTDGCQIDESKRTACIACFMEKCYQIGMVSDKKGWVGIEVVFRRYLNF